MTMRRQHVIDAGRDGEAHAQARLLAGAHTMVLHVPGGPAGSEQAHPQWTILLPLAGHIVWWTGQYPGRREAGVIFPPRVPYRASSRAGHISVFIDSWFQGLGPGQHTAVPLGDPTVSHLRFLWSRADVADLDESAREALAYLRREGVLPPAVVIDPRVETALRDLRAAECVDHLAAGVGLSPSRLRALIRDLTGISPARLRMWQRLRAAMLSLPDTPIALAAADAGFADQAHLTRTTTRLVGRTPGELARTLRTARTSNLNRRAPDRRR
jgi:AraC-like DNA-binding protein